MYDTMRRIEATEVLWTGKAQVGDIKNPGYDGGHLFGGLDGRRFFHTICDRFLSAC